MRRKLVAFFGTEEGAGTESVHKERSELCGDDPFKKKILKDAMLRLVPYVTARNGKRSRK